MGAPEFWPDHAYVPGVNGRHPEGAFDHIRQTARPDMDAAELAASDAFRHGILYLEAGYFWEAHEVLEPVWMALAEGRDRQFVQCLIQLANGFLKLRMQRPKAALRLSGIARALLPDRDEGCVMTVSLQEVKAKIDSLEARSRDAI